MLSGYGFYYQSLQLHSKTSHLFDRSHITYCETVKMLPFDHLMNQPWMINLILCFKFQIHFLQSAVSFLNKNVLLLTSRYVGRN